MFDDYTNLWVETVEELGRHGKKPSDICFVCGDDFGVINFKEVAIRTNYDDGFGGQEIAEDLKVVGEDWWLERHEYDGSEWWEFKAMPQRPKEFYVVESVTADVGWDTLKEIKEREND